MKRIILFLAFAFTLVFCNAQITSFQKYYNVDPTSVGGGYSIKQTPDGGYAFTGYCNFSHDAIVVKTDYTGSVEWSKQIGRSDSSEYGISINLTNDDGYIVCAIGADQKSHIYLFKLDSVGNTLWTKEYADTAASWVEANTAIQTSDGGYIIAAKSQGMDYRMWIIKTDTAGNITWSKKYNNGLSKNRACDIRQTSDHGYIVTGKTSDYGAGLDDVYLLRLDSSGGILWNKIFGSVTADAGNCVRITPDGGYIICGTTYGFGAGLYDILLIKTDSLGSFQWAKAYGTPTRQEGYALAVMPDGGFAITGSHIDQNNRYRAPLIRTDASGNVLYSKYFPGRSGNSFGYDINATTDGGIILVITTADSVSNQQDALVIKTDFNGNSNCSEIAWAVTTTVVIPQMDTGSYIVNGGMAYELQFSDSSTAIQDSAACFTVSIDEELQHHNISVYPNPFSSEITIQLESEFSARTDIIVELFDVFGKEVAMERFSEGKAIISRQDLVSGIYFYHIVSKDLFQAGKIIAE
jgi:hypothetical protein